MAEILWRKTKSIEQYLSNNIGLNNNKGFKRNSLPTVIKQKEQQAFIKNIYYY